MNRSGLTLFVSLLFICVLHPVDVLAQEVPEWASEQLSQWYAAYNSGDVEEVTRLYSEDAVLNTVRGRKAQTKALNAFFAESTASCKGDFELFVQIGHTAVGWGYDECKITSKGDGQDEERNSKWLVVFERQEDDSWLIVRDVGEQVEK